MMRNYPRRPTALLSSLLIFGALTVQAQSSGSTRPRRVSRQSARTEKTETTTDKSSSSLLDVVPANGDNSGNNRRRNTAPASNSDTPLLTPVASTPVGAPITNAPNSGNNPASGSMDTTHAFSLLKAKQYDAALKEARQITESNPNDSEGWKIAGFAEINLKQYEAAATDLQKALDLQRAARQEDPFTIDALGHAYFLAKNYERALPFLVTTTNRKDTKSDAITFYYRGVAEYETHKIEDAERTFNGIVKDNPKD